MDLAYCRRKKQLLDCLSVYSAPSSDVVEKSRHQIKHVSKVFVQVQWYVSFGELAVKFVVDVLLNGATRPINTGFFKTLGVFSQSQIKGVLTTFEA